MKHKYERLMHIEQVLSKLERCIPMGLRKEVEISQALHNVGQLIEDCMEEAVKADTYLVMQMVGIKS